MLLQTPISQSPPYPHLVSLSSSSFLSHSLVFPSGFPISPLKTIKFNRLIIINCSKSPISKVYSYGTVDYEKQSATTPTWKAVYKKISMMGNSEVGCASVLSEWENKGAVIKFDLCRIARELRKFGRHKHALEVYQWMNNRAERYRINSADAAIQLDLISKVHGTSAAQDYFMSLPNKLVDKRIYGALLNAYAGARKTEEAESLLVEMKKKGYLNTSLPYNVMMTLYRNLEDFEKVYSLVSEMMRNNIALDVYSYNIWISSCGLQGSIEKMEEAVEKMKLDMLINPNWTVYSSIATYYIKFGEIEKAEDCLRKMESKISGRDRAPYHYLLSHYASISKKEEVQRVWETYKLNFPYITNFGYFAVISSFIRMDDIEEAEKLYDEWLSVKLHYDPRIGNLFLGWYSQKGLTEKADVFFRKMLEVGNPNAKSWEMVAEGHIRERRISDALSCLETALSTDDRRVWRPHPVNISSLYEICEQEKDEGSKEALFGLLRKVGVLDNEAYMSCLPFYKASEPKRKSTAKSPSE